MLMVWMFVFLQNLCVELFLVNAEWAEACEIGLG